MASLRTEDRVEEWSKRQGEVLDAALELLVSSGSGLTMNAVARRANCSKETLYKWFGGRDGLLTATVQRQASKVRAVPAQEGGCERQALMASLERFASDWLKTIAGETSVALNRLAVGQAGSAKRDLGAVVLHNGPFAMQRRLSPLLEAAREGGLLAFDDAEAAFRTFFGLVVRDMQIRLLLGERPAPEPRALEAQARHATEQFMSLYGAQDQSGPKSASLKERK
ncbi:TetR/AcrR family transcriptional regulator [Aureimonas populi]|uniref:TetR/AcrR family transcriptional regulator n=1 Tax=Aureimonas populi TaxID=1701758 RepID=A0ABW5CJ48_9HYPH|nr:TetR/AcrR family transcriptional regulator [Aureimonas populi]